MIAFWKRFWTTLISIAGVVALYLAARAENFLWAFWLVVLAALTITTTTLFAPRSLDWIRRVRDYPRLLEAAARLQADKDGLAQNVDRAVASAESNWDRGVAEGRAHVLGCLIAQSLDRMPELKGVEKIEGQAVLLAQWDPGEHILGARFHLEVEATGYIRGVLEVIDFERIAIS